MCLQFPNGEHQGVYQTLGGHLLRGRNAKIRQEAVAALLPLGMVANQYEGLPNYTSIIHQEETYCGGLLRLDCLPLACCYWLPLDPNTACY